MGWRPGDVIVERQIWHGAVMLAFPTTVLEATNDHLVAYIAPGAPFWFPDEPTFPSPTGRHPWFGRQGWRGHGAVVITPYDGDYSVWHFWQGEDREFARWYLNIQEQMRPTAIGFDSQDLELDYVVWPNLSWEVKDDDILEQRVVEGRWTTEEIADIRRIGAGIVQDVLEPHRWWWDTRWTFWVPDPEMPPARFPSGWRDVPVAPMA